MSQKNLFEILGAEIGKVVGEKNKAYGNAFGDSDTFLKLVYPNGIEPHQYAEMFCLVRIFDKLKRIASGNSNAFGEDSYKDLLGLVTRMMDNNER